MNVFAKFDEIPTMIFQDIKETKRYVGIVGRLFEISIPSHKHSIKIEILFFNLHDVMKRVVIAKILHEALHGN